MNIDILLDAKFFEMNSLPQLLSITAPTHLRGGRATG